MSYLNCPVGAEASTMVAIWHEAGPDQRIIVALADSLPEVPQGAVVASMADLMSRGLFQRIDAERVSADGESRN